jgi:LuxR family maltose regulon positive regulatory protein
LLSPWQLGEAPDEALLCLEQALVLAEPEGYVRAFAGLGESMELLLRQAMACHLAAGYAAQLLSELGGHVPPEQHKTGPPHAPDHALVSLIEPLSNRELEVLRLLAEGLTNVEIGQRLYISLPTVKSHTRNIYGKLGVHSRREAVSQAKSFGILL